MHQRLSKGSTPISIAAAILALSAITPACADPVDSMPLGPGASVVLEQTLQVPTNGASARLHLPGSSTMKFDYVISPASVALDFVVITDAQYQELTTGEQLTGSPVYRSTVSGSGTMTVPLNAGDYGVFWVFDGASQSTELSFRASH